MVTRLSVNVNKVALLRNTRSTGQPSVLEAATLAVNAGAQGITVHPRPDRRHIRPEDVHELAEYVRGVPNIELNVEGNPFHEYMPLARATKPPPHQCTLVPDSADQATSDHGWDLEKDGKRLRPIIAELKGLGARVSLFMDADSTQWQLARSLGADRVEMYTEPYATAFARGDYDGTLATFATAARSAQEAGLGVNAGHDLNLENLKTFCSIPGILEVSIGHALIADALKIGMTAAVKAYLKELVAM